jgi:hypothetical protein
MQMIFRHISLHNRHFVLPTNLTYQIPPSQRCFFRQRRAPILRPPDPVKKNLENRMRAASMFFHPSTLS